MCYFVVEVREGEVECVDGEFFVELQFFVDELNVMLDYFCELVE